MLKCHFYLLWGIRNDRPPDRNYLHAPLNRTAFCESSPSIKLGPEPWQGGCQCCTGQHGSDQRRTEKQNYLLKLKSVSSDYPISAETCGYGGGGEGNTATETKESFIIICTIIGKWWHTKHYYIHISTFEEKCKNQITSLCAESSNHFRICALSIDKILTTQSVKRNPPKKDLRYSWGSF